MMYGESIYTTDNGYSLVERLEIQDTVWEHKHKRKPVL